MLVTQEMYKAIQDYAYAHYEEGWDVVVEAWDINEVQEVADLKGATDYDSLFAAVKADVEDYNEYQSDIQGA